jgi:hypothetical protein
MKRFVPILLLMAACGAPDPKTPAAAGKVGVDLDGSALTVSGPYQHENLAVYLIHAAKPDERDFITLDEGLERKWVEVAEKASEQVSELMLENKSDRPLFIQEGDRVVGGKQDRIIGSSFVVPPKSGKVPVPSFCVEQGRWHEGQHARGFVSGDNRCYAPKEVRSAAKYEKDQGKVWENVAGAKKQAQDAVQAPNTDTSLNETLENAKVKQLCDAYAAALSGVLEKHKDAVGVAIAMNGKIEEINIYPAPALLRKIYARIVQSYTLAAVAKRTNAAAPAASDVVAMMKDGEKAETKKETINGQNEASIADLAKQYRCETKYEGKAVHRQWMAK